MTFDKRMSNRWGLQGSIMYSAFRGNTDPGYSATEGQSGMFDNPNVMINAYGPVAFDRPFQLKLMGTVMLPFDIVFTGYFQARSGSAWRRTIDRVYFPGTIDTQDSYIGVAAEKNGSRRNPSYTMLDIRVEKSFAFGDFGKLSIYLDAFNLGGRSGLSINGNPYPRIRPYRDPPTYAEGSTYADITSVYGSRSFRIGAKFAF
jgi:hypothetical protein